MQSTEPEIWKPVVGYEGRYEVSDHGRVRSLDRTDRRGCPRAGRILAFSTRETGHRWLRLSVDSKTSVRYVHWLVLEAFAGPRPDGMVACHNDGDATNNRVSNLRWDTQSANVLDEVAHGTHHNAAKDSCPRGHRLVSPNLTAYSLRRGHRTCLACQRAHAHARHRREPFSEAVADEKYRSIMQAEGVRGWLPISVS